MNDYENIEIEAKYKVLDIDGLQKWLLKHAKFLKEETITDKYYVPEHRNFLAVEYPYEWLRLRSGDKGSSINYKHWYPPNKIKNTYCHEIETLIGDVNKLEAIFTAQTILKISTLRKFRIS